MSYFVSSVTTFSVSAKQHDAEVLQSLARKFEHTELTDLAAEYLLRGLNIVAQYLNNRRKGKKIVIIGGRGKGYIHAYFGDSEGLPIFRMTINEVEIDYNEDQIYLAFQLFSHNNMNDGMLASTIKNQLQS